MTAPAEVRPPGPVIEIARTLHEAGFETWCVGGAVRDALLGRQNQDWDLATSATPKQVQRLFRRTVPVGLDFGTVGVLDRRGVMHEVTTFRKDVQTDGRHAVVEFGASLDEDLARRDFTINAIAFQPLERRLHDPFGGRADLERGIVRAVGVADDRLREDRLRALRAIRFAARFGFAIDADTWAAIVGSAPHLGRLSPERVKQEMEKTFEQVARPSRAFRLWREAGAFATVVPVLANVSDETLASADFLPLPVLRGRPQRRALRMASLFSEQTVGDAERALRALRCSNQDIAWVAGIAGRWQQHGEALTSAMLRARNAGHLLPPDGELRRLAAQLGRTRTAAFVRLAAARWAARCDAQERDAQERDAQERDTPKRDTPDRGGAMATPVDAISPRVVRALHRRLLKIAYRDAIELADLAVDGDDLRSAGVPPGPLLGRILTSLLDAVVDDPTLNARSALLERAATLLATPTGHTSRRG